MENIFNADCIYNNYNNNENMVDIYNNEKIEKPEENKVGGGGGEVQQQKQLKGNYDKIYDTYYSQYSSYNNVPVRSDYDPSTFEYGYSFLPPEKWYPEPIHPPICITDKTMPIVYGVGTSGFPYDHKQWI